MVIKRELPKLSSYKIRAMRTGMEQKQGKGGRNGRETRLVFSKRRRDSGTELCGVR